MEVQPLRVWRLRQAYGVGELAKLAGVDRRTIATLEAGTNRGHPRTWRAVATALGITPAQILEYRLAMGWPVEEEEVPS